MNPEISVVVPMRNESPNVEQLYRDVTASLSAFARSYEIVAVDDGSRDDTFAKLVALQQADSRVRAIRFRRNFGQTAAFSAGFAYARGRYIVTMDGDNQNDPADIPGMIQVLEQQNLDIVCGWRKDRKDAFINRRLPSMIANALISRATGVKLHDYGCSLKVFRAEVVKQMKLYGEMHRFLPAIAAEYGVEIGERVVNHRARVHGVSNYGIMRTFRVILDLMTVKFLSSYKTRPLQMFGSIGFVLGGAGALMCAWVVYQRFFGFQSANRPLLIVGAFMVLAGLSMITSGLQAEILARTYHESQDKPTYVIREIREASTRAPPRGGRVAMRRFVIGSVATLALAFVVMAGCGGKTPLAPGGGNTKTDGTGSGGGGGVSTAPNTPPTVKSIVPSDTRAEVGTPITLTATVEDAETPVANLGFAWSAPTGTFGGSGSVVTWTPGADAQTPADITVTLTVTETYTSGSAQLENNATGTVTVHVNNSPKELADLSLRFLGNFANS